MIKSSPQAFLKADWRIGNSPVVTMASVDFRYGKFYPLK